MKKITFLAIAAIAFVACKDSSKTDSAKVEETKTVANPEGVAYKIDSTSSITWVGSKKVGNPHTGIFKLSEGSFSVKNDTVTGGTFVIDINSLANQDMINDPEQKGKLEGHLKSPDFFDVTKYPTAKFEITEVKPYVADSTIKVAIENPTHTISGNLTLKDQTKNVSFPAKITVDAKSVSAIADFNIDRTIWGMNYKGPNNPQDWFISKDVNIKLNLVGTK